MPWKTKPSTVVRQIDHLVHLEAWHRLDDRADWNSRSAFDDGLEPEDCLEIIAEAQDFPGQFHECLGMRAASRIEVRRHGPRPLYLKGCDQTAKQGPSHEHCHETQISPRTNRCHAWSSGSPARCGSNRQLLSGPARSLAIGGRSGEQIGRRTMKLCRSANGFCLPTRR